MRVLQMVRIRMRAMMRADFVDRELDEEIREHLAHIIEENLARGMTPDAAHKAAHREFGPAPRLWRARVMLEVSPGLPMPGKTFSRAFA